MFQRMMAIPQEEYMQLTAQQARQPSALEQVRDPLSHQFRNLESQYQQHAYIADPYSKLVHQSETLGAMKALKEKMRQGVVAATPKPFQSRAQSLLQHLDPVLKMNERGELLDHGDQVIPQSRIDDLVQHAVRDRRRNFVPAGWNTFLKTMKEHNIPKYMLNRNTLDEMDTMIALPKTEIKTEVKNEVKKEVTTPMPRKRAASSSPAAQNKQKRTRVSTSITQRPKRLSKRPQKYGIDFLSNF